MIRFSAISWRSCFARVQYMPGTLMPKSSSTNLSRYTFLLAGMCIILRLNLSASLQRCLVWSTHISSQCCQLLSLWMYHLFGAEDVVNVHCTATILSVSWGAGFHKWGFQYHRRPWLTGQVWKDDDGWWYKLACRYRPVHVGFLQSLCPRVSSGFLFASTLRNGSDLSSSVSIIKLMLGWMLLRC